MSESGCRWHGRRSPNGTNLPAAIAGMSLQREFLQPREPSPEPNRPKRHAAIQKVRELARRVAGNEPSSLVPAPVRVKQAKKPKESPKDKAQSETDSSESSYNPPLLRTTTATKIQKLRRCRDFLLYANHVCCRIPANGASWKGSQGAIFHWPSISAMSIRCVQTASQHMWHRMWSTHPRYGPSTPTQPHRHSWIFWSGVSLSMLAMEIPKR